MADTNDGNTMVQLVAALHAHIIQEEAERRRNPEAWLATLTTTTRQQWAFVQCMRRERERREAQAYPAGERERAGRRARRAWPSAAEACRVSLRLQSY